MAGRMQESQVPAGDDVDEVITVDVTYFDEVGVKGENVRIAECKRIRRAFPQDLPVALFAPAARVDEERALAVVCQEQPVVHPVKSDRPYGFPSVDHIE